MEKIKRLRQTLFREQIDGYIIPKNDEFFGEYVFPDNDRLKYISNFSGSFGFALILNDKNYLFIDGRYTLQAKKQCAKNFNIITFPNKKIYTLFRNKKHTIGFDPKLFTQKMLNTFFRNVFKFKPINSNLVDEIWKRKIKREYKKFYTLPRNSVDNDYRFKINKIVSILKKNGADYLWITASENNAWLLNVRGKDSKYSPIPHCHSLIDNKGRVIFFCDLNKVSSVIKRKLKKIKFFSIKSINDLLLKIKKKKFIIDRNTCSVHFEKSILKNNEILKFEDPIYFEKAIKSKKEIYNIKKAHYHDGVAVTKYLFWIKKNFYKRKITEISGSNELYKLRKKNNDFKSLSFPTISGTGPNAAIIHYMASKKTDRKLKKGDIYLVDSGGQYNFGTTDVTRTISLKNSNKRIKDIYTRVLKGHIAVVNFNLKKNSSGSQIDKKARKYLKQIGLNYSHGTGHGVGYFLNVHEGPHGISKYNKVKLKEGMILSNEPGYYETDKFGIRIENLIYIKKEKNKTYFENLTMVPIDKDLINKNLLNKSEKKWLNNYHMEVFNLLKNSMNKFEILELKQACSAI